jgi:ribosomal protein S13
VIANRDHVIKLLIQKFIDGLRSMLGDVDPNLTHRIDRLRPYKACHNARTENFKPIAGQMTQESFSHLAARRVAGAENQNPFPFLLISHSYLASDPIAETK